MGGLTHSWRTVVLFRSAFAEHTRCMRHVYDLCDAVLQCPAGTPPECAVAMGAIPATFYSLRNNLFSTLFMSVYHRLGVAPARRLLYGQLNHLFRIWVTGADNLLDGEDKVVLPLKFSGTSRVMRDVVAIMTADRVLARLLAESRRQGVLSDAQADRLSDLTLQLLLPSAGQEAGEEQGVALRPPPEIVLRDVHRYKTGMLFHVPFIGPDHLEYELDPQLLETLKNALMSFGLGCQILDDIRDVARDLREKRHNILLSKLLHENTGVYATLDGAGVLPNDRLYSRFPDEAGALARQAFTMMRDGLATFLDDSQPSVPTALAQSMFTVLDLEDLAYECR